jgi:L-seryl-tRNA(Ser) seleniumtransferase
MAGMDLAAIDRLPDTSGMRNEVVLHRAHRNAYDHAVRATGARLTEFGYLGAVSGAGAFPWQLRAAITPATAAVYYFPGVTEQVLDLATVVRIAHEQGVPVIVDASSVADLAELRSLIDTGADLVAVSGGKSIAGPAGTGFLAGRRDLITSAALQQQDAYVHPDLWSAPAGLDTGDGFELPHQGIGRTMKVGREEIAGLLVALRSFAHPDSAANERRWAEMSDRIAAALPERDGVRGEVARGWGGVTYVTVRFHDAARARRAAQSLETGQPRIFANSMRVHHGELTISPYSVRDDELEPLARRLREVVDEVVPAS